MQFVSIRRIDVVIAVEVLIALASSIVTFGAARSREGAGRRPAKPKTKSHRARSE